MTPTYHTRMIRGQTKRMTFTVRDEVGRLVDLTGAKVYFTIGADLKVAPSVKLTSDAALPGTDATWRVGVVLSAQSGSTLGQFVVTVIRNDTKDLVALGDDDPWLYDAWIVEADGDSFPVIATSKLGIYPEVTTLP